MPHVLDVGHIQPVLTVAAARGVAERGDNKRVAERGDNKRVAERGDNKRVAERGDDVIRPQLAATIRAVAAGDQDAFSRLYASYVRMVHAILLGRVPRRDVDDLVQEVFLAAYLRIGELRDAAAFAGWIAAIARNRATDHLRQSREQVELPDELPGGDPIEAETLAVLDAVRKLPETYRETLLMRLVEGMSGNEIAERTGLTPASVRVHLHRGMKLLREKLGMAKP